MHTKIIIYIFIVFLMVGSDPIPEEQVYTFLGVTLNCIRTGELTVCQKYRYILWTDEWTQDDYRCQTTNSPIRAWNIYKSSSLHFVVL
jgi:hypothetical protein